MAGTAISPATRERILRAAAKHGHRPHPGMREMLSGRSDIVQAAFPSINNIFFMDLAAHLAAALRRRGLSLQLAVADDSKALLAVLEDAAARRHRLAIFIPPAEKIAIPLTLSRHLALFTLVSPCRGVNVRFLSPDERRHGARRCGLPARTGTSRHSLCELPPAGLRDYGPRRRLPRTDAGARAASACRLCARAVIVGDSKAHSHFFVTTIGSRCRRSWALQRRGLRVPQDVSRPRRGRKPDVWALFIPA